MPLLTAERNVHPSDLFDTSVESTGADWRWWVLHTRPRQEKALARQLLEQDVPFYLPTIAKRLRMRDRKLTSHVPLFAGYLFLLGSREHRLTALTTNRVVYTIDVADQATLWRDLRQVHQLIASGKPVTPEDRLAPGSLVEITSGALAGLKGKILRTASGNRFVVEIDFIQRGASVLLDDHCLAAC